MIERLADWQFAWPWLLLALPLPLLALWLLPPAQLGLQSALRVPFGAELEPLAHGARGGSARRLPWLALLAWALLCVAAARPQELGEASPPPQSGRDLMLVVDLSASMAEADMHLGNRIVDRLTAVKAVLADFLDRRVGDRVGLLLFGQRAYAVTPLTLDRESVRQQLLDSVVGLAGRETAIGDALALSVKRLSEAPQPPHETAASEDDEPAARAAPESKPTSETSQRVVILLTDGVNTAGALTPQQAAELARDRTVRVHTIGFGSEDGRQRVFGMPVPGGAQIDEKGLQQIAQRTGGRYFRARDTRELAGIYAELDRIEPNVRAASVQRPRIERYLFPLAAAVVLAALLALSPGRRSTA